MLKLSKTQQRAIRRAHEESHADELHSRMLERAPVLARTFDEQSLARAVRATIAAAGVHGFTYRGPVRLYFDLCLAFGSGFVGDPMYPWAARAIGDGRPADQMARADDLFAGSLAAFEAIHGPHDEHARAAQAALKAWARAPHLPADTDEQSVAVLLRSLHPHKAAHVGDAGLHDLVRAAKVACDELGFVGQQPITLISTLKFTLGAGCLSDPFHAWIEDILADRATPTMARRFEHLEHALLRWIDAAPTLQPAG